MCRLKALGVASLEPGVLRGCIGRQVAGRVEDSMSQQTYETQYQAGTENAKTVEDIGYQQRSAGKNLHCIWIEHCCYPNQSGNE